MGSMGLDDLLSAFAGVNMDDHEQLVGTFARVLGADADQSRFFLEASAWNLESAVGNFLDTVGTRANLATPSAEPASTFRGEESVQQVNAHVFAPGQPIQLVWTFVNVGPAPWPLDAALVHTEGDALGGNPEVSVGGCQPSVEAPVQLNLRAPASAGSYASAWRLRYSGGYFGDAIWLVVNVDGSLPPAAPPAAMQQPSHEQQMQQMQMMMMQQMQMSQQQQQMQTGFGQPQPQVGMAQPVDDEDMDL